MPTPPRPLRYVVESTPRADLAADWDRYLDHHLAEVVLTRKFTGAALVRTGEVRRGEYEVPDAATFDRYVAEDAPALRADAEAHFPAGIDRQRRNESLSLRISAPFEWGALGLVDASGTAVPCPADGPFRLSYFAPWCPDCTDAWPALLDGIRETNGRGALVRVYAAAPGALERDAGVPVWSEPGAKDETTRVRGFQGVLRALSADGRRWGVPVTYDLFVARGRFVVCWR